MDEIPASDTVVNIFRKKYVAIWEIIIRFKGFATIINHIRVILLAIPAALLNIMHSVYEAYRILNIHIDNYTR